MSHFLIKMLNVTMPSVAMINIVMLSVVALFYTVVKFTVAWALVHKKNFFVRKKNIYTSLSQNLPWRKHSLFVRIKQGILTEGDGPVQFIS